MLQAVDCLIEKGHSHIGLINGPSQLAASKERLEAYKKGLNRSSVLTRKHGSDCFVRSIIRAKSAGHGKTDIISRQAHSYHHF
jgi:DNA-binding LacI/PurR family transcriptional regulator